ncbi:transfer protein spdA [Streptomyces sp. NPDC056192]|uniref:transfer protein spdA n=1 Tax=Streptomyces sp. NPDC056192 TaxID=3345743 RepID=UPI0035D59B29
MAVDLFLVWAVRSGRDVLFAVAVAVAANVAGVLTAESLRSVDTWVSAGLHAVFPVTLYRMHRPARPHAPAEAPAVAESAPVASAPAEAPHAPAEAVPDAWPDVDLWQDFADTAPDSEADAMATPPSAKDMRAAVAALTDRHGRPVTGRMVADHFGVSERTGRRYLAMTA